MGWGGQLTIDDVQFRFTHGKSTIDATFIVRQFKDMFRVMDRMPFCAIVDLEKHKVPRQVVK